MIYMIIFNGFNEMVKLELLDRNVIRVTAAERRPNRNLAVQHGLHAARAFSTKRRAWGAKLRPDTQTQFASFL